MSARRRLDATTILVLGFSVSMSVISQVMLRHGMSALEAEGVVQLILGAARSLWIIGGLSLYMLGTVAWLVVLSRIDLAVAYPLGSLNYVFITLLAAFVLREQIPLLRWAGTLVILTGIVIIARGESSPNDDAQGIEEA